MTEQTPGPAPAETDHDRGFRHGTDGIDYYPGPACRDPAGYLRGYAAGREYWRSRLSRRGPGPGAPKGGTPP